MVLASSVCDITPSIEEKCESGLVLSEIHPGILRAFRNRLRDMVRKKWEDKLQKRNDNTGT